MLLSNLQKKGKIFALCKECGIDSTHDEKKRRNWIIGEHTERSLVPKSGVKSDKISTWVFSMQIS
jgi:hypothetical protein